MNGKQTACIILLMIMGAVLYGAQIVHKKSEAAVAAAQAAQLDAEAAEEALKNANTTLERTKYHAQDLQRFLSAWTPQIERMASRQQVEEAIQANTREKGVFVVNQRFEDKNNAGQRMMPRSVLASLVLEDEYAKVMNWLGDLERKIPLARVTSCRISAASTGRQIHMEMALEVPLIDLNVNPLGVTEKKGKK
jgi:hypothetical protein